MGVLEILEEILKQSNSFDVGGSFSKNKVLEKSIQEDPELISLIHSNEVLKETFFYKIDGFTIFKRDLFNQYLFSKEFLPGNFTRFKNKIGLVHGDEFILNRKLTQLAWPYKDCTLIGGAEDPEDKKNQSELMLNNFISNEEVTRLDEPKAFTNAYRIDQSGKSTPSDVDTSKDNFVIRGNNYVALNSLIPQFSGSVKLIYIDPPYNTKNDSFRYNDSFTHSTWLTFMKNRLEVAKELLSEDGSIFVHIDDNEEGYLKVLMDEIFGRQNFVNTISVKMKSIAGASGGGQDKKFQKNVEYIQVYAKNYDLLKQFNFSDANDLIPLEEYYANLNRASYSRILIDEGKLKFVGETITGGGTAIKIYEREGAKTSTIKQQMKNEGLTRPQILEKYYDKIFDDAMPQSNIRGVVLEKISDLGLETKSGKFYSIEYIPKSGKNANQLYQQFYHGPKLRLLTWLSDVSVKKGLGLFYVQQSGTSWDMTRHLNNVAKEGGVKLANGKKPEYLLQKIILMATNRGDLVLDYHLGSGTTAAVAHKCGRRYIGVEQLDYGKNDPTVRLQNVINGDKTGISNDQNWQGGGSFVYMELAKLNQTFIDRLHEVSDEKGISSLVPDILANSRLSFNIRELEHFKSDEFNALSLDEKKKLLLGCLDKNHLYIPRAECEDKDYALDDDSLSVNKMFYGE